MLLSEKEIKVFFGRSKQLQTHGLNEQEADDLAWQLLNRDRDPTDDRRICLACGHLSGSYCNNRLASKVRGFQPCKTVLWRCDFFKQKG